MEIVNVTRAFTISPNAQYRDTFLGRFRGLMLSPRRDIILAGKRESIMDSTIHMMWMLYPIDVIWVSAGMKVVDVKRGVPPFNPLKPKTWELHEPKAAAKYVVEVSVGDLKDTQTGDDVAFR